MRVAAETIEASCCDDEFVARVWLSAPADHSVRYVTLSRYLQPGEDDRVYIECGEQARCGHDLVSRCFLRRDELRLELTQAGARVLGLGDDVDLIVTIKPQAIADLWEMRRALAVIFLGSQSTVSSYSQGTAASADGQVVRSVEYCHS
jgi:hypothetical protein